MKVGILGSKDLFMHNFGEFIPKDTETMFTTGEEGIGSCAKEYAMEKGIKVTEFFPEKADYLNYTMLPQYLKVLRHSDITFMFFETLPQELQYLLFTFKKKNTVENK